MSRSSRRPQLTPARIIDAAVAVADRGGVTAITMRRVADELGVEAMSLYHHVDDKEALLDGVVDAVMARIDLPAPGEAWQPAMRRRARSARQVLGAHPWALALLDSRRDPGLATLEHHEAVLGCLRSAGHSIGEALHAFALLDAFVYGFVQQEQNLPFDADDELADVVAEVVDDERAVAFPFLAEAAQHAMGPDFSFAAEFEWGLGLILDGLADRLQPRDGTPR